MKKLLFILLLSFTSFSFAQVKLNKVAQSTMNFLLVGTSAKACAMGEAFTVLGNSSESMFYNPAGLADVANEFDVSLNITSWIADIDYMSGSASWNLGNYGVVGLNLLTVDYGTIIGTSLLNDELLSLNPLGYTENGEVANVGAYAFGVSYAKAISTQFAIGGNMKIAAQNLCESLLGGGTLKKNNATKLVFDAGVKYKTGFKSFAFGMAIRNFASNIKREEIDEQLPLTFTLGAAMDFYDIIEPGHNSDYALNVAVDFLHQNNYSERVNFGAEYKLMKMIYLRAGYQTNRDLASWSGGLGIDTSISDYDIQFNYSYSRFEIFDSVNRISVGLNF